MLTDTKAFSSFAVPDLQRADAFYRETLGLRTTLHDDMPLLTLHLAGDRDTMVYEKPDFAPATYTILNFTVGDVDAAADALAAKGVQLERYEGLGQDEKGIARGRGPDIAWFKDPFGNVLSVLGEA